jgi:hypothetical protein
MRQNVTSTAVELVAVGEASTLKAQSRVIGCQNCSASVSQRFSSVLIEVLGAGAAPTEYLLCAPAQCPNCNQPIFENTLVRCEGDGPDTSSASLDFGRCWDGQ